MRLNFNLGFLKGFRWRIQSREHERSSLHWLAGETWQTVKNLMCCFHIVNQCIPDVLRLLEKKKTEQLRQLSPSFSKEKLFFFCSHFMIERIWGISWFGRVCHQIQGDLTHDWRTGVFREQFVDVFHHSGVYIHQLHVSTAQTTPGRLERSPVRHFFFYCF